MLTTLLHLIMIQWISFLLKRPLPEDVQFYSVVILLSTLGFVSADVIKSIFSKYEGKK